MSSKAYFDAAFLRRLESLRLIAKRLADRAPAGGQLSRTLGDGLEFADHRAYTPGDDVRFLDWPYFARMEKLLVRLFHRHSESDVAILLDASASMAAGGPGKFDHVRRVVAALAYVAVGGGRRVVVQPFAEVPGRAIRSARDRARLLPFLDSLAALHPRGQTALGVCVRDFVRRTRNVGTVFLVSDLLDAEADLPAALASLDSTRRDVVVLHAFSPLDAAPTPIGAVQLRHAETGRSEPMDITAVLCERYAAAWGEFRSALEHTCRARQATYIPAPTDAPFERLLLHTLRRAGVLDS
ncbi:MAG: DUF58 domain-containing protein [Phycisphaerae bacterium]|nr:DUF58 domain-containing protein [Phycisphaerae bacterium]